MSESWESLDNDEKEDTEQDILRGLKLVFMWLRRHPKQGLEVSFSEAPFSTNWWYATFTLNNSDHQPPLKYNLQEWPVAVVRDTIPVASQWNEPPHLLFTHASERRDLSLIKSELASLMKYQDRYMESINAAAYWREGWNDRYATMSLSQWNVRFNQLPPGTGDKARSIEDRMLMRLKDFFVRAFNRGHLWEITDDDTSATLTFLNRARMTLKIERSLKIKLWKIEEYTITSSKGVDVPQTFMQTLDNCGIAIDCVNDTNPIQEMADKNHQAYKFCYTRTLNAEEAATLRTTLDDMIVMRSSPDAWIDKALEPKPWWKIW